MLSLWQLLLAWLVPLAVCVPTTTSTFEIEPTPSTLIDILSSDAQFSYFLRVLQRRGLVPVLNTLQNVTLLAPVNSAFAAASLDHVDNDELLRYVIDQRFRVGYMARESVVFNTLYSVNNRSVPVLVSPDFQQQQYVVDRKAYIVETDIYAKHQWSFIQAIDQLLPKKPSVCDVLMLQESPSDGLQISFIKRLFFLLFHQGAATGDFSALKKTHKKPIIPKTCEEFFQDAGTIFIPTDDLIASSMSNMTARYYSALYHTLNGRRFTTTHGAITEIRSDIYSLLQHLMVPQLVTGGNMTNKKLTSLSKAVTYKLTPSGNDDTVVLNGKIESAVEGSNVALLDGMVHVFDFQNNTNFFTALDIPVIELTPKKALLGLHYLKFVSELEFRSLDHLIDGSTENQTIFLSTSQRDDFSNDDEILGDDYLANSFSSKQELLYQFADEEVDLSVVYKDVRNSTFYKLVDSKLCSKKRINGCFKLKISSSFNYEHQMLDSRLNDDIKVVSEPFDLGNRSIAYIVDDDIETPSSFKHTLGQLMSNGGVNRHLEHIDIDQTECLRTIQYLSDSKLLSPNENNAGYSVFLPCGIPSSVKPPSRRRGAWKSLGLLMNYLEQNPKVLKDVLKGFFVEGMIYSDFGLNSTRHLFLSETLRGDTVNITSAYYDGNYNHLLKINETFISLPLNSDLVFSQGVIHIVSGVMLPENFQVSFVDLIRAAQTEGFTESFLELLVLFPKLYKALALDGKSIPDYSLLVPTPESLLAFNVTEDFTKLFDFLQLHLIPNSELPALFACTENARTEDETGTDAGYLVHSNFSDVSYRCFKNPANSKSYLEVSRRNRDGIVKAQHKVKIVSFGCTSPHRQVLDKGACVFMVDRPINPKWLVDKDGGFLHVHIGFLSVGLGIILGLTLFCGVIFVLMFSLSGNKKKKDKPSGASGSIFEAPGPSFMRVTSDDDMGGYDRGYETDDDMFQERERLLPTDDTKRYRSYGAMMSKTAAPMKIKLSALNRNRNLPGM